MSYNFVRKISDYIESTQMPLVLEGKNLVAGLSGGADSVCLFLVLLELRDKYNFTVSAAHVNHGIRESAKRDEEYVKVLCEKYEIPLTIKNIDCVQIAKANGLSVEEAGRYERYSLFNELAGENGLIAVAHHKGDVAETVLFNMVRGSGLRGLTGIKPVQDNILRPLLCVTRDEILNYLSDMQIEYMTDETNFDDNYSRNLIRNQVLPKLAEVNSRALEHIVEEANTLSEIEEYIMEETDSLYERSVSQTQKAITLDIKIIDAKKILAKEVIYKALSEIAGRQKDISKVHVESVYKLLTSQVGARADLIYGIKAVKTYESVDLYIEDGVKDERSLPNLDAVSFIIKEKVDTESFPAGTYTKWIDCDKINGDLVVRTRQTGDYIVVNGQGGRKSLKDYFIDLKIPKEDRDSLLLVADGSHVVWVVGYRISEAVKVTKATKRVYELKYVDK